ncbi:MAG: hypothetical protein WAT29_09265 [Thiolinea sp.]
MADYQRPHHRLIMTVILQHYHSFVAQSRVGGIRREIRSGQGRQKGQ